jgi:hypothetical protein
MRQLSEKSKEKNRTIKGESVVTQEQIEKYKKMWIEEIYNKSFELDSADEYCWKSLAYGFFLGKGLSKEEAEEMIYKVPL